MSDMLFLAHRLPYPPDKGDKVRSYHLLRQLSRHFKVHLGCFFDDPNDGQHAPAVESLTASAKIIPLSPGLSRMKSVIALFRKQPLSIPYFFNRELADWVGFTLRKHDIRYVVVYSSPMAQYVMQKAGAERYRVMDFVDVDSDKWHQYSRKFVWPMSYLYAREGRLLAAYERKIVQEFDAASFVTQNEVELFHRISPETGEKHHVVPNGVDTGYFDPAVTCPNPYGERELPMVFTGMMSYWPNADAVTWFAREVFPRILASEPRARFWIVGASPNREVRALQRRPGITVTGRVPDVRPYLRHAALVVAPLRIARGVQNKVLESMAMGCSVLCSDQAAAGLQDAANAPLAIAHSAEEFATRARELLSADAARRNPALVRQYVLENYNWERNLQWFLFRGMETRGPATERAAGATTVR